MYKNFFFLSRFVEEANQLLQGYILISAFSQEKDKLILSFRKKAGHVEGLPLTSNANSHDGIEEIYIELSVNHGFPYITLRSKYSRAKRNTVSFFEQYLPSSFNGISIKKYDRVIQIEFDNFSLFYMIRGKFTNLALLSESGELEYFKHNEDSDNENLIRELTSSAYAHSFQYPEFQYENPDELKKKYSFIGREILMELKARGNSTPSDLIKLVEEIRTARPSVFYYPELLEYEILFDNFRGKETSEISTFNSTSEAFYFFISHQFTLEDIQDKKKRITKHVNKQLEKLSTKLNSIDALLNAGSKEEIYNQTGNLLLINIGSIKAGAHEITLHNIYTDKEEIIKLDPSLAPGRNAELYFDKARNEKTRLQKGKELKQKLEKQYYWLRDIILKVESTDDRDIIISIMKELKMKENENNQSNDEQKNNFKHYSIEEKYDLYVGKDSKSNDELTTRFAKQNDFWFHARGLPGSHVVLRNENTKEAIPKNILKKAASIAAFHSKGKTAGVMPVSYCQKKYVVKKKGMAAGKVALLKEEVLLVKPEIPEGCEFIGKE